MPKFLLRLVSLLPFGLLLGIALPQVALAQQDETWSADRVDATRRRVAGLIEQLGSPEYIARRSAEIELGEIGLPAFDQVLEASRSPDPEVSAACTYLLSELAVEWAEPDDPPSVRGWLKEYGSLSDDDRQAVVDQIVRRWNAGGLVVADVLCRIARFDPSPRVASRAAAALVDTDKLVVPGKRLEAIRLGQTRLDRRHGPSRRPSQQWLDAFAAQGSVTGPAAADALTRWKEATTDFADEELNPKVDPTAHAAIAWNRLRLQLATSGDGAAASVGELVSLANQSLGNSSTTLRRVFDWLIESKADRVIDTVAEQQQAELATKAGGYLLASVRHRQGRIEEADELAAKARSTPDAQAMQARGGVVLDGRIELAGRLRTQGHAAWAHGEYRDVIDAGPPLSPSVVFSQRLLADSLQDAALHTEAADVLTQLATHINANARSKRSYERLVESWGRRGIAPLNVVEARRHYNQALAHRAAGDEEAARTSLAQAIQTDRRDADILIAMHRSPDALPAYRREVLRRIRELAEEFEREIEEDAGADEPLNQWAWLIGNTEGDYQQAIEYSERSLRLAPGDPGYLDTLARCYFAAGRIEDAVRAQRQAVTKLPHMQVMQRQLAEFEAAATKLKQASREEP